MRKDSNLSRKSQNLPSQNDLSVQVRPPARPYHDPLGAPQDLEIALISCGFGPKAAKKHLRRISRLASQIARGATTEKVAVRHLRRLVRGACA